MILLNIFQGWNLKNKIYLLTFYIISFGAQQRLLAVNTIKSQVTPASPLLSLAEAEERTLQYSSQIKVSELSLISAQEEVASINATRYPKLSLVANFQNIQEVPKIKVGLLEQPLSDHRQYSIGPTLSYSLWDGGLKKKLVESLRWKEDSLKIEKNLTEIELKLNLRTTYVKAQLVTITHELVKDALRLALEQAADIQNKYRAGAISRMDLLNSQFELANAEIREKQAKSEKNSNYLALARLIGEPELRYDWRLESWDNQIISLKNKSLQVNNNTISVKMSENSKVKLLEAKSKSMESLAESKSASHWPQIQLSARSSLDYPFGPEKRQFHQNTIMATLQWDLYDFGGHSHEKAKHLAESSALTYQSSLMREELEQKLKETDDQMMSLVDQLKSAEQAESESGKLADLKKQTYKLGKMSYLDVATSQVQHLDSQIRRAKIEAQLLIQKHQLEYLQTNIEPNTINR